MRQSNNYVSGQVSRLVIEPRTMAELEVVDKRKHDAQAQIDKARQEPEVVEEPVPEMIPFEQLESDVKTELVNVEFSSSESPANGSDSESFFYDPPSFVVLVLIFIVLWVLKRV